MKYLIEEKEKQKKICNLSYNKLEMQEYLLEGNINIELSKLIFKARGRILDIKAHKRWRFDDNLCVGCGEKEETEEELLSCPGLVDTDETNENIAYSGFFGDSVSDKVKLAKIVRKHMKARQKNSGWTNLNKKWG